MHELSIAKSVFDTVRQEMRNHSLVRVDEVCVRVGVLSDVYPEALKFAFEAICIDTELASCRLTVDSVPMSLECAPCGATSVVDDYSFVCPRCGSTEVRVAAGYELEVAHIEVPDEVFQQPSPTPAT